MRTFLPAAILLVALLAAPANAQMDFPQAYQVRAGVGDIPSTTDVTERAGTWNVEQRLTVTLNGTAKSFQFLLPAGSVLESSGCTCANFTRLQQVGSITLLLPADEAGSTATLRVLSSQPYATAVAFAVRAPANAGPDAAIILYVPPGSGLTAPGEPTTTLPGASTPATIQAFTYDADDPMPDPFWASVHPATTTTAAPGAAGVPWLYVGLAFALGALLWALLVQRGVVQKRGRKQVAQVAAHVEVAAQDPPAVLEGKKRALLAALKEVELARQAQEMDVPTYDAVKAEFKKQAVTVMRALETSGERQA